MIVNLESFNKNIKKNINYGQNKKKKIGKNNI